MFLPIVFVEGMTRQLFADMALTITYSLLASLIVALTLVPAIGSGLLRRMNPRATSARSRLQTVYLRALQTVLRHKAVVLLSAVALLALSAVLAISRGFTFMPAMDSTQMSVSVTLDEDATLDQTAEVCDEIASRFATLPEVETVGAMQSGGLGSILGLGDAGGAGAANAATMYIVLSGSGRSSTELAPLMQQLCDDLPCTVSVSGSSMDLSMLSGSGITVRIYGEDLDALLSTSRDIAARLSEVEGVASVSDGEEETTPELQIHIDRGEGHAGRADRCAGLSADCAATDHRNHFHERRRAGCRRAADHRSRDHGRRARPRADRYEHRRRGAGGTFVRHRHFHRVGDAPVYLALAAAPLCLRVGGAGKTAIT